MEKVFDEIQKDLDSIPPLSSFPDEEVEARISRDCILLAYFEYIYRALPAPDSPLLYPKPMKRIEDVLSIPQEEWILDLKQLSTAFYSDRRELLNNYSRYIGNPVFTGSRDVQGADADFILDDCLYEIKTITRPEIKTEWLYQLIGYCILDYDDSLGIRDIGFYFSRQRLMLRWALPDVLDKMSNGSNRELSHIQTEFRQMVSQELKPKRRK